MAAAGQWGHLKEWQERLDGGRVVEPTAAAPLETPAAAPAPAAMPVEPVQSQSDDLTKIEGVGPKIAELLNAHGIKTYAHLASTSPERITEILNAEGGLMASRDPSTWPDQSAMAAAGQWEQLKQWQDQLDGGVGADAPAGAAVAPVDASSAAVAPAAVPAEPAPAAPADDLTKIEGVGLSLIHI